MPISASLWDPTALHGPARVSALHARIAEAQQRHLLPPQFVLAAFARIGGRMLEWHLAAEPVPVALGYCFPARKEDGTPCRLVSYLPLAHNRLPRPDVQALKAALMRLGPDAAVQLLDITTAEHWPDPPPVETVAGIAYGQPRVQDAHALRQLQALVWQAQPENLYPTFLHHPDCLAAWSLVARAEDQVVGFLLGFWHDDATPSLPQGWPAAGGVFESQTLGVHPDYRQLNIGFHLKRIQAQELQNQGISHVQWTADPLQYRNASLNCNRLGAVGTRLLPDYLPFRNELNRVSASRLRVVWSLPAAPPQRALTQGRAFVTSELDAEVDILPVHHNLQQVRMNLDAPCLAIEIPADWTQMQRTDLALAQAWRDTTDAILTHYLGPAPGQYMITHTGRRGDHCYLLATQVGSDLLRRYGA